MTEEWLNIEAKGLRELCAALERAESKGYLPDAITEAWAAFDFNYLAASAPVIADAASAGVISAAESAIHADRAQALTTAHINALENAIAIQRGNLKLPPGEAIADTAPKHCPSCGNHVAIEADHEEWCSYLGWKKRALEAEELNRKFMESVNGPTHMGEPVIADTAAISTQNIDVECTRVVDEDFWKLTGIADTAKPVAIYQMQNVSGSWSDISEHFYKIAHECGKPILPTRIVYAAPAIDAAPDNAQAERDALKQRGLDDHIRRVQSDGWKGNPDIKPAIDTAGAISGDVRDAERYRAKRAFAVSIGVSESNDDYDKDADSMVESIAAIAKESGK